jgi:predicted PurR-regulated permease PerM
MSQQEELDRVGVYQPDWALWVRQCVAIGLVIGGVYAVTLLSPAFPLIIATFLLSFLTYFAARSLASHSPFSYRVSVLLISALIAIALLAMLLAIVPSIAELFREIFAGLYRQIEILKDSLVGWNPAGGGYSIRILDTLSIDITPIASQIRAALVETDPQIAQQLARTVIVENMPPIDPVQILSTLAGVVIEAIGTSSGIFATLFLGLFLSCSNCPPMVSAS